jgi:hypothetical protein
MGGRVSTDFHLSSEPGGAACLLDTLEQDQALQLKSINYQQYKTTSKVITIT